MLSPTPATAAGPPAACRAPRRLVVLLGALACLAAAVPAAPAEQASSDARAFQAGQLDAGREHTCAILAGGVATCWGNGGSGRLGDGGAVGQTSPVAVVLPAGRRAVAVGAGGFHTCLLLDDGAVRCAGLDGNGQLGDGSVGGTSATPVAVQLPATRRAVAVTAGDFHACAALDDGGVRCWGLDTSGQLGDGDPFADRAVPARVAVPGRARAITAGARHTCAALDDGTAVCWGDGLLGQLGRGVAETRRDPVDVTLPTGRSVATIAAGGEQTCAILDDGSVRCWGALPGGVELLPSPVALPAGRRALALAVGDAHVCVVLDDGALRCLGADGSGQLGDGAALVAQPTPVPVALPAGRRAVGASAGQAHTCVLLDDGSVRCVGADADGRLGNGVDGTTRPVLASAPAALPPGAAAGRVADVEVMLVGLPAALAPGGAARVTVRVRNRGADVASAVRVHVEGVRIVVGPGATASGTVVGGTWRLAPLAAGGEATLAVRATAVAAGAATLAAEVVGSAEPDPDATAADGAGDDRAVAAASVRAPVERLALALVRSRDGTAPYTVDAVGRLEAPAVALRTACAGSVRVAASARGRVLAARQARLRIVGTACRYAVRLTVTEAQRRGASALLVQAAFAGSATVRPATSPRRLLALGDAR